MSLPDHPDAIAFLMAGITRLEKYGINLVADGHGWVGTYNEQVFRLSVGLTKKYHYRVDWKRPTPLSPWDIRDPWYPTWNCVRIRCPTALLNCIRKDSRSAALSQSVPKSKLK